MFTGAGEPFVTAAGVLGLMAVWRAFYTVYLDFWNFRTFTDQPINRYQVFGSVSLLCIIQVLLCIPQVLKLRTSCACIQDMSAFMDALR